MRKKIVFILICALSVSLSSFTYAQESDLTPSPNPSPTNTKQDDTIQILKEKIEEKVDQLNKKNKKIITGKFISIDDSIIVIKNESNESFNVAIDDTITKIFTTSIDGKEEISIDDLEKDDKLIVEGPILEGQISANIIYKQFDYLVSQGQITGIDKDNFTIDVITSEKDEYTLSIEKNTVQRIMHAKTLAIEKAGFSKYKVGDSIHFVSEASKAEEKQIIALRTVIIPQEFFTEGSIEVKPED